MCLCTCVHTREEEGAITFMLYAIETMYICIYIYMPHKDIIAIYLFFELYIFISIHRYAENHKSWTLQQWVLLATKTCKLPLT